MISQEHVRFAPGMQQLAQSGKTGLTEYRAFDEEMTVQFYRRGADFEPGFGLAEQCVYQPVADFRQEDDADAIFAGQPFDCARLAVRVGDVVTKGLAPAGNESRIAADDPVHVYSSLAFAAGSFNQMAYDVGIGDESLQLVVVDHQHAFHAVLDHQPCQIAHVQMT